MRVQGSLLGATNDPEPRKTTPVHHNYISGSGSTGSAPYGKLDQPAVAKLRGLREDVLQSSGEGAQR
jgi:hypothetical protein